MPPPSEQGRFCPMFLARLGMQDSVGTLTSTAARPFGVSDQVEEFCKRARAEPALAEALRQPEQIDEFIALAVTLAAERGLALTAEMLSAAMRGALPGAPAQLDLGNRETELPPAGWLPTRAFWRGGHLYLQWSFFGQQRLEQPFFEWEVHRCLHAPFNRLVHYCTPIEQLGAWLERHPPLHPNGFVFHMSRCGSTLVSQMLAASAANVVVSEASPIDAVVGARLVQPGLSDEDHRRWLQWIVGAFGQARTGSERRYFIKLDSWHTLALPLFARAFPDVPWVFLYRDPVEVLVSQMRMPGIQMIPGALGIDPFGIAPADRVSSPEDYCARVLASVCQPVLQHGATDRALLVNYSELPEAVWQTIMPHFGVDCSESDRALMAGAARFDAKAPSFRFAPDADTKQREASASIRSAAQTWLNDFYLRLEARRAGAAK